MNDRYKSRLPVAVGSADSKPVPDRFTPVRERDVETPQSGRGRPRGVTMTGWIPTRPSWTSRNGWLFLPGRSLANGIRPWPAATGQHRALGLVRFLVSFRPHLSTGA